MDYPIHTIDDSHIFPVENTTDHQRNSDATQCWVWLGGFLFVFGIFGNIISIYILYRTPMKLQRLNMYLMSQIIVDTGAVIFVIMRKWLVYTFDIHITQINEFMCKTGQFLSTFVVDCSSWNLVLLSLAKMMLVTKPLSSRVQMQPRSCRIRICVTFTILALYNSHFLVGMGDTTKHEYFLQHRNNNYSDSNNTSTGNISLNIRSKSPLLENDKCTLNSEAYRNFIEDFDNWLRIFIHSIIPSFIMMVCNVLIIRTIVSRPSLGQPASLDIRRRKISSNTRIVIYNNILFFLTCTPVSINILYDVSHGGYKSSKSFSFLRLLSLTHHSLNFICYMLTCKQFRNELGSIFRCFTRWKYIENFKVKRGTMKKQEIYIISKNFPLRYFKNILSKK